MRTRLLLALGAVIVVASAAGVHGCLSLQKDPREIEVGAPAPRVGLLDSAGRAFSLDALAAKGRPVLVFFRGRF